MHAYIQAEKRQRGKSNTYIHTYLQATERRARMRDGAADKHSDGPSSWAMCDANCKRAAKKRIDDACMLSCGASAYASTCTCDVNACDVHVHAMWCAFGVKACDVCE